AMVHSVSPSFTTTVRGPPAGATRAGSTAPPSDGAGDRAVTVPLAPVRLTVTGSVPFDGTVTTSRASDRSWLPWDVTRSVSSWRPASRAREITAENMPAALLVLVAINRSPSSTSTREFGSAEPATVVRRASGSTVSSANSGGTIASGTAAGSVAADTGAIGVA